MQDRSNILEAARRRAGILIRRALKVLSSLVSIYALIVLVGLIPVNNDFKPSEDGVQILLVSNSVHADIIVPRKSAVRDWSSHLPSDSFNGATADQTHIAFGWGDRGFYLETPTWNDLKLSTAANALLWPSNSCIHVSFTYADYLYHPVAITISESQYEKLIQFIDDTFERNPRGEPIQIKNYAYSNSDAFFDAKGSYHLFNTCNCWVNQGLKSAGIRSPWFAPMPQTPMLYLVNERKKP